MGGPRRGGWLSRTLTAPRGRPRRLRPPYPPSEWGARLSAAGSAARSWRRGAGLVGSAPQTLLLALLRLDGGHAVGARRTSARRREVTSHVIAVGCERPRRDHAPAPATPARFD